MNMEGYPFRRLSHDGDSHGLSNFSTNGNGKETQNAFKGRTNSSKTGGSVIFVFESWRWKAAICIFMACFLAVDFILQGTITTLLRHYDTTDSEKKPNLAELQATPVRFEPNLTEILDSGENKVCAL